MSASDEPFRRCDQPKLLVSVRSAPEAVAALAGGADWIDLKEPLAGPLGAVDEEIARSVSEVVLGRAGVSAALGELGDWPTAPARRLLTVPGIRLVKLGLSGCALQDEWLGHWQEAAREVAAVGKELVAVAYVDSELAQSPSPQEVLCQAIGASFRFLLLDTFNKQAGTLLTHLPSQDLAETLQLAIDARLQTVVAGGLLSTTLSSLPEIYPDVVAVRGGVCALGRSSEVQQELVQQFRAAITARWPG